MTETSTETSAPDPTVAEAVRQRVMHRTSGCDALAYQYGWNADIAEARYDADTLALATTGTLPDLPPSPDITGQPVTGPTPVLPDLEPVEEPAAPVVAPVTPEPAPAAPAAPEPPPEVPVVPPVPVDPETAPAAPEQVY